MHQSAWVCGDSTTRSDAALSACRPQIQLLNACKLLIFSSVGSFQFTGLLVAGLHLNGTVDLGKTPLYAADGQRLYKNSDVRTSLDVIRIIDQPPRLRVSGCSSWYWTKCYCVCSLTHNTYRVHVCSTDRQQNELRINDRPTDRRQGYLDILKYDLCSRTTRNACSNDDYSRKENWFDESPKTLLTTYRYCSRGADDTRNKMSESWCTRR